MLVRSPNPFFDRLRVVIDALDPITASLFVIAAIAVAVLFFFSERRVEWLLLVVIASSALVGSSNDMIDNGASVLRWVGIAALVLAPLMTKGFDNPYRGSSLLFVMYAGVCFLCLFNSLDPAFQMQRGVLLLGTSIAIPSATAIGVKDTASAKRLYTNIGLFGSIVALVAAAQLPGQLGTAARFYGTAKGVPYFAIALGSLLPFMFLNAWQVDNRILKIFCLVTFVLGSIVLFFTAQRAGTIAGLIGIAPMLLVLRTSQKIRIAIIVAIAAIGVAVWAGTSGLASFEYVSGRYSSNTGLSGRDAIWSMAWEHVSKNILIGHGTGGADLASQYLFHNSYLEVWYNGGILALICFVGALGRSAYIGSLLVRRGGQEFKKEMALSLGFIFGVCFVSFFEGVAAAGSTISVIVFLVATTILERRYQQFKLARMDMTSSADVDYAHPI